MNNDKEAQSQDNNNNKRQRIETPRHFLQVFFSSRRGGGLAGRSILIIIEFLSLFELINLFKTSKSTYEHYDELLTRTIHESKTTDKQVLLDRYFKTEACRKKLKCLWPALRRFNLGLWMRESEPEQTDVAQYFLGLLHDKHLSNIKKLHVNFHVRYNDLDWHEHFILELVRQLSSISLDEPPTYLVIHILKLTSLKLKKLTLWFEDNMNDDSYEFADSLSILSSTHPQHTIKSLDMTGVFGDHEDFFTNLTRIFPAVQHFHLETPNENEWFDSDWIEAIRQKWGKQLITFEIEILSYPLTIVDVEQLFNTQNENDEKLWQNLQWLEVSIHIDPTVRNQADTLIRFGDVLSLLPNLKWMGFIFDSDEEPWNVNAKPDMFQIPSTAIEYLLDQTTAYVSIHDVDTQGLLEIENMKVLENYYQTSWPKNKTQKQIKKFKKQLKKRQKHKRGWVNHRTIKNHIQKNEWGKTCRDLFGLSESTAEAKAEILSLVSIGDYPVGDDTGHVVENATG
jgi:hypothetical protein